MTRPETKAVHAGSVPDPRHGAVAEPIVLSSTFEYPERRDGSPAPYIYTRYANPTIDAVERRVAALEESEDAVLFASGMAAISGALLSALRGGAGVLTTPLLYGGTDLLFERGLSRLGITTDHLSFDVFDDPGQVTKAVQERHTVLYLESPTNPMLRVLDLPALISAGHDAGLTVIVDNTFAGPILSRPALWGADHVCESATKSMGGHSDLIAGIVAGKSEQMATVRETRRIWGGSLDPAAAYRLQRGLMTLPLRIAGAGKTARAVAEGLAERPWVKQVFHPALSEHPDHHVAQRVLDGPLPLVTFVMHGGDKAAIDLRRRVRLVRPAASLGGAETLLSLPGESSHAHLTADERTRLGIPPGSVRLALGLEHAEDLLADLDQAAAT